MPITESRARCAVASHNASCHSGTSVCACEYLYTYRIYTCMYECIINMLILLLLLRLYIYVCIISIYILYMTYTFIFRHTHTQNIHMLYDYVSIYLELGSLRVRSWLSLPCETNFRPTRQVNAEGGGTASRQFSFYLWFRSLVVDFSSVLYRNIAIQILNPTVRAFQGPHDAPQPGPPFLC